MSLIQNNIIHFLYIYDVITNVPPVYCPNYQRKTSN